MQVSRTLWGAFGWRGVLLGVGEALKREIAGWFLRVSRDYGDLRVAAALDLAAQDALAGLLCSD